MDRNTNSGLETMVYFRVGIRCSSGERSWWLGGFKPKKGQKPHFSVISNLLKTEPPFSKTLNAKSLYLGNISR